MRNALLEILRTGIVTQRTVCPDLSEDATGLPALTANPCTACGDCASACPTNAISVGPDAGVVTLDRGKCIGCNLCVESCPTGTITGDRSTRTAVLSRADLVLTNRPHPAVSPSALSRRFRRSLHIREVATGDSAADSEVTASTNALFDIARFGVQFVASPRFADALLVTGPVPRAMQDPLRRCYDAMAEPRLVIAAGTSAISGGIHRNGYTDANGVSGVLPVDVFIPGDPPHPWSIIHGILLAMGRVD